MFDYYYYSYAHVYLYKGFNFGMNDYLLRTLLLLFSKYLFRICIYCAIFLSIYLYIYLHVELIVAFV